MTEGEGRETIFPTRLGILSVWAALRPTRTLAQAMMVNFMVEECGCHERRAKTNVSVRNEGLGAKAWLYRISGGLMAF